MDGLPVALRGYLGRRFVVVDRGVRLVMGMAVMVMAVMVIVIMAMVVMARSLGVCLAGILKAQRHTMGGIGDRQGPEIHKFVVGSGADPVHLEAEGLQGRTPVVVIGITLVWIAGGLGRLDGSRHQIHPLPAAEPFVLNKDVADGECLGFP